MLNLTLQDQYGMASALKRVLMLPFPRNDQVSSIQKGQVGILLKKRLNGYRFVWLKDAWRSLKY